MMTKITLLMIVAFAVGTCERPEYSRLQLVGEYTYEGKSYQVVQGSYDTKSSSGSALMLFESGVNDYDASNAVGICLDTSFDQCRIEFGKQLRADGAGGREASGMGY
ncbi:hypothetical protein N9M66_00970 [Litoreibacter sp.]|nr:hypothetical protein [Litoreibacter sp.]